MELSRTNDAEGAAAGRTSADTDGPSEPHLTPGQRVVVSPRIALGVVALLILAVAGGIGIGVSIGTDVSTMPSEVPRSATPDEAASTVQLHADLKPVTVLETSHSVDNVVFGSNGKVILAAGFDAMSLWDVDKRALVGRLNIPPPTSIDHQFSPQAVAFSHDGQTLATGRIDGTVLSWKIGSLEQFGSPISAHAGAVRDLAFSPDGLTLATTGNDNTTRIWSTFTYRQIVALNGGMNSVAFSPDGGLLATADDTGVRFWNAKQDYQPIAELPSGHPGDPADSLVFSPDGKYLAANGCDGYVCLWDVQTRRLVAQLTGSLSQNTRTLSFSPDGSVLATAEVGVGGLLTFWDVNRREQLSETERNDHGGGLSIAFSPTTKLIATGEGSSVLFWRI